MSDTTFRTKAEQVKEKNENITKDIDSTEVVNEPIPYTEYKDKKGLPYTAEYYDLGEYWDVYNKELSMIEDYIGRQVNTGEVANSTKAVDKIIKGLERINNLKDEERKVIKIETIASYIKFLNDTEGIKLNYRKYGNT